MSRLRMMFLVLTMIFCAGTTAVAQDTNDTQTQKIILMLSGYEYFPTKADLEAADPDVVPILISISEDKSHKPSLRLRAIDALGLFNNHEAAQHFELALAGGELEEVYLRHSITASLKAFGQTALPWVQPYMGHTDPIIRVDAAHAVTRFGGTDGLNMIRARQQIERDPYVRGQLIKLDP